MRDWRKYDLKKLFLENGRYIVTVVHETGNLKKIMFLCVLLCPPVLLTASEGFHLPEENKVRCPAAVYESRLSITRELRPNGQTRQRWSNMNQYSVTVMPISRLKCFQNHLVVYCLAVKWESLWPSRHCKICWRKPSSGHMTGAQPIGTLSLWNDLWLSQNLPSRARFF